MAHMKFWKYLFDHRQMKWKGNKVPVVFDLFFCLVFMPLLVILGPAHYWMMNWPLFFIIVCVYFYACYFAIKLLNFPELVIRKDYVRLSVAAVSMILGNLLLTLYPLPALDFVTPAMSAYQTDVRDYGIALGLWLMFSLVISYSLTVSFVKELYGQLLLKRKIENQRDKAQLAMLKAQISPHFLFNTLNSLYSLVIGTSQKAEDAFIKFADLLKYTYVISDNESVPLSEEIAYIQNYIDLQAIRLNGHTHVKWVCDVDDAEVMIPPMILLTFVENVFKYGVSANRDCEVMIALTLDAGKLRFITRNHVMKHADEFRREVPVGMDNCRARLDGIFPGRHSLVASETDGVFEVRLEIKLL